MGMQRKFCNEKKLVESGAVMKILIKGAGDLATGIAVRLVSSGYQVLMTEISIPTTVRRTVAFSRAVYDKEITVEGVKGILVHHMEEIERAQKEGVVPIIVDPQADILKEFKPQVLVDAIIGKMNLGTNMKDAGLVIGVGPGFIAGVDCHVIVETKRGHYLGRVIKEGSAIPDTGIPGDVGGYTVERIIRSCEDGIFEPIAAIGDFVERGQVVAKIAGTQIKANISGIVRGMLQPGVMVTKNMKCGDIDARCKKEHCFTISDKARAIGGGVLEAVVAYEHSTQINGGRES